MKTLREQIRELADRAPKDFDPEALDTYPTDDSDGDHAHPDGAAQPDFDGREHYEQVAPSKLRKPVKPVLGKRYAGSLIKRADLLDGDVGRGQDGMGDEKDENAEEDPFAPVDEGNDDDPFAKGGSSGSENGEDDLDGSYLEQGNKMKIVSGSVHEDEDEEIDSDEAFGEDDAGKFQDFKFLGSGKKNNDRDDTMQEGGDTDVSSSSDGSHEDQLMDGTEDISEEDVGMEMEDSEASSGQSDMSPPVKKTAKQNGVQDNRAALKALLSSDTAAIASSLSAAASADAKKGRAVKAQYQTFDRLLDARIKLQKGLTAANSITPEDDFSEHQNAIKAAEEASLTLWNTITSIRHSLADAQSSNYQSGNDKKRKRPLPATSSTPLSSLWSTSQALSSTTLPHHRTILNRWSAKVRATNPTAQGSRPSLLIDSRSQSSITDIIDGYLAVEGEKLISQSTTPTPNPPSIRKPATSTHQSPTPTPPTITNLTYNDTLFYQSLLRDLITSRSSSLTTTTNPSPLPSNTSTIHLHPPGSRTKSIDTKASKGRKIRYTVFEKLQNFMAAEDEVGKRWTEEARREFFASLLGGKGGLAEDGDAGGEGEAEEGGLRLFRN